LYTGEADVEAPPGVDRAAAADRIAFPSLDAKKRAYFAVSAACCGIRRAPF
jgi:hypothetical protein